MTADIVRPIALHHFGCIATAYYLSVHPKNVSGLIALLDSPKSVWRIECESSQPSPN